MRYAAGYDFPRRDADDAPGAPSPDWSPGSDNSVLHGCLCSKQFPRLGLLLATGCPLHRVAWELVLPSDDGSCRFCQGDPESGGCQCGRDDG